MALPAHLRVRVVVRETASGAEAGFVLYYERQTDGEGPTVETIQETANDFKTAFSTAMPSVIPNTHTFQRVEVQWVSSTAQVDATSNNGSSTGGISGGVFPEEVAVVIQRRTGMAGRSKRGRVYLPSVPLQHVSGSTLSTGGAAAYQGVASMIVNNVTAAEVEWTPRQPSFKTNDLLPVVSARVYNEVCSRRDRRFVKRGSVTASIPV